MALQRSYIWIRAVKFLWPFIIIIDAVRAILMIVQLNRGKDKIIWECQNGGQLWGESESQGYANTSSFPDALCGPGFQSLFTAFIICLLADLVFVVRIPLGTTDHKLTVARCTRSSSTGAS